MHWTAFIVFIIFFIIVTILGFVAARWRKADLTQINEWGLAGRSFGTVISWFLLGGDLYTAYTFIAIPAAMYGVGAVSGFYAVPYTILVYPLVFILMPRFWAVCKQHGYVTASDFVKDRFGSSGLALAVAFTGILATMPYIALQMYGIQISLAAMGVPLTVPILGLNIDIPLLVAFVILAAYTYTSGLRAPAMIALVKDVMIFIVLQCSASEGAGQPKNIYRSDPEKSGCDIRDAGTRFRTGTVSLSTFAHRCFKQQQHKSGQAECSTTTDLFTAARFSRADGLYGHRGTCNSTQRIWREWLYSCPNQSFVPSLVCGFHLRSTFHWRTGASSGDVDRGCKSFHTQYIQGIYQTQRY
jgi:Na+/proline symporter